MNKVGRKFKKRKRTRGELQLPNRTVKNVFFGAARSYVAYKALEAYYGLSGSYLVPKERLLEVLPKCYWKWEEGILEFEAAAQTYYN